MVNDTLKEYYVKLTESWNNAIHILDCLNKSLSTNSSEISVDVSNGGNNTTYRIPSFLYIENKIETLANNFESLFNLPESGEAWLVADNNVNTFKLEMVRTGTSPVSPIIPDSNINVSTSTNNFLKDLVSPKTFLRLRISNLPENIEKVMMKKFMFNDMNFFNLMKARDPKSYDEFVTALYTLRKGIDYTEYETVIDLPVKRNKYLSSFNILNVDNEKTYVSDSDGTNKTYTITVNTLKYFDQEDPSIEFNLKIGDILCLGNSSTLFVIKNINHNENILVIEEKTGHYVLQDITENPSMILGLYNNDYSQFHYVDIPLEDKAFIAVSISTIQNNVRSILSEPKFYNLNEIYVTDENGQFVLDNNGNKINYMQYYDKYCVNIGSAILGLTDTAYPQLTALSNYDIEKLEDNENIKSLVTSSFASEDILKVLPINSHITNSDTANELISMHAQKNEISSKIKNINDQIYNINNQLATTDFSQDTSVSQLSLKNEITTFNTEKMLLQKQLISLVENININSASIDGKELKYRIRGITKADDLQEYLKTNISEKIDIIGIDVEYKYKSINKTVTSIISIGNAVFSDWNKYETIDKERLVKIDANGNYYIEFEDYSESLNTIKWNQIDIPIVADEDVVIRVRYKYNIGQPFINIYSPWSNEYTVIFPTEYKDNIDVVSVINENKNDIISARLDKTLIDNGYTEHIDDGIIDGNRTYYHDANNIYSGFINSNNMLMSIKDKFNELQSYIDKYQSLLDTETLQKYKVFLSYDDIQNDLLPNTVNNISISNTEHLTDSFVKKKLNIVIKNVGDVVIRMYSQFPGNISVPLLLCYDEYYEKHIVNYERVPIVIDSQQEPTGQVLGQWIYFRENNPWTKKPIYYRNDAQDNSDFLAKDSIGCIWKSEPTSSLMKKNYSQVLLGCRKRAAQPEVYYANFWGGLVYNTSNKSFNALSHNNSFIDYGEALLDRYKNLGLNFFIYNNINNDYLVRYEDINYNDNGVKYYLDNEMSIFEFCSKHKIPGNFNDDSDFTGAFLYPELPSLSNILTDGSANGYVEIPVGESLTIPLTLEFFLNENLTSVHKAINFDIKPSAFRDPIHYSIDINCLYDYTSTGNTLSNISLFDESIE